MRADVCFERHATTVDRIQRNEDDIKDVWKAVESIRQTVQGQANKIAYIVGGITVLVNFISLALQYFGIDSIRKP